MSAPERQYTDKQIAELRAGGRDPGPTGNPVELHEEANSGTLGMRRA